MIAIRRSTALADATQADLGYAPRTWLAATGAAVTRFWNDFDFDTTKGKKP